MDNGFAVPLEFRWYFCTLVRSTDRIRLTVTGLPYKEIWQGCLLYPLYVFRITAELVWLEKTADKLCNMWYVLHRVAFTLVYAR